MKEKATIYDYARLCDYYKSKSLCDKCPMLTLCSNKAPSYMFAEKSNEIILNWCKEQPGKTRKSEFLKIFPNANVNDFIDICPQTLDTNYEKGSCEGKSCVDCKRNYWLAEVEE